jgi:N-methylhydantoinase A
MTRIVAVDTGGTFTDLVSYEFESKKFAFSKSLTTYNNLVEGIAACLDKSQTALDTATFFKHGTTLVINTLLERSGGPAALITTRGFRDIIELGRGNRPDVFDLFYRRHPALISRNMRFEVDERTDGQGNLIRSPKREEIKVVAAAIRATGAKAVAISFLNSYLRPDNELAAAELLREMLPGTFITCGAELSREWYEYERTCTAAANAYVGPRMTGYLESLESALNSHGFSGQPYMMGSNGGVLSVKRAAREPITLVESGPIGGCIGAATYAHALGIDNIIAFDMGGTTAKCALVSNGQYDLRTTYYIGGYERGIPIRGSVADMVEVGAGGGSIAWLDAQKRMSVGPRSAGSSPGPACYAKGGSEPTVTDANLVLGRLSPENFLGGEMTLIPASSKTAIESHLAAPLGYAGEEGLLRVSAGILEMASVIMAGAIKRVSLERGRDPRDFVLFAYGGGGPLHSAELARELYIPLVIIPPEPGNFSATGMLLAHAQRGASRTILLPLEEKNMGTIFAEFNRLEEPLREELSTETKGARVTMRRSVELRYRGQTHSVEIPFDNVKSADELKARFTEGYKARYGHADPVNAVEMVAVRSTASAELLGPDLERLNPAANAMGKVSSTARQVYFAGPKRKLETRVFKRSDLPVGFTVNGPALIEEYGSTTLVGPQDRCEIGRLGEIRIHVSPKS